MLQPQVFAVRDRGGLRESTRIPPITSPCFAQIPRKCDDRTRFENRVVRSRKTTGLLARNDRNGACPQSLHRRRISAPLLLLRSQGRTQCLTMRRVERWTLPCKRNDGVYRIVLRIEVADAFPIVNV